MTGGRLGGRLRTGVLAGAGIAPCGCPFHPLLPLLIFIILLRLLLHMFHLLALCASVSGRRVPPGLGLPLHVVRGATASPGRSCQAPTSPPATSAPLRDGGRRAQCVPWGRLAVAGGGLLHYSASAILHSFASVLGRPSPPWAGIGECGRLP